eukprot:GHVL01043612.1.p1 GENE.GHVL01043612.1~~GHVL01043612.1.p1  ORF type:complete len:263 (+),score=68.34 GHVL01043612.1:32-790(+)
MAPLTVELIRSRAEHNDKNLDNLKEISLHQFEIEKIENLNFCRHLNILLLQNNIIGKIENLSKLHELEYLNLAINNIKKIENLEKCENLKKLDLTLNFIDVLDLEESLENLKKNENLEVLYLTGNPCTDWKDYRDYVISKLDNLSQLDGTDILKSEKIKSKNKEYILNEKRKEGAYTIEERTEMYRKLAKEKEEKEERQNGPPIQPVEPLSVFNNKGDIRMCNQGQYKFTFNEEPGSLIIEIFIYGHKSDRC